MNVWDDVKKEDLEEVSESMSALADIVGIQAVKEIVHAFGGGTLYIPMPEALIRRRRDCLIYEGFNGCNYRELARQYNLSIQQIRNIIQAQKDRASGQRPVQRELF